MFTARKPQNHTLSKARKTLFLGTLFLALLSNHVHAQREAVDRTTGSNLPACQELECFPTSDDYSGESLSCLKCYLHTADSTLAAEYSSLLVKLRNNKKKYASLEGEQKRWQAERERKARKEGNEYKGGTMEITEYIRMKLLLTEKRITTLRNYKV